MHREPAAIADLFDQPVLPEPFEDWFAARGWAPRRHQLELLSHAQLGKSVLLIAPTGGGKTLAGFLPSLLELNDEATGKRKLAGVRRGPHTLYISPLKALAVDVARNVGTPIAETGLPIRVETRTGDTPQSKRARQKHNSPDILMTTPEQISLLLTNKEAEHYFAGVRFIIFDELHALSSSKRGVLLSLCLARVLKHAPATVRIGLSATVAEPDRLRAWLMPQRMRSQPQLSEFVQGEAGAVPQISILKSEERIPWSEHTTRYAMADVYGAINQHKMVLIFVNTRSQAEMTF